MKKMIIPVMISEKLKLSWNIEAISLAPFERKQMSSEVKIIQTGLNFASQHTIMAVKPFPPAVSFVTV